MGEEVAPWVNECPQLVLGLAEGSSSTTTRKGNTMTSSIAFDNLQTAEEAYLRVKDELEALPALELSPLNVDLVSAASIVLGVVERLRTFRSRMAALPEFLISNLDKLEDYARCAWYVYITNLPTAEPKETEGLLEEVQALRAKLLMWAEPLVGAGKFERAAIDRVKEGAGHKDAPSDVVALVGLYRARWAEIENMCGVTEQDLERGAQIAPLVFALIARRENKTSATLSDGSLRVRRAWTLLDRAYAQCRRALQFLRYEEGDVDLIAPSLRRNSGTRSAERPATASSAPDAVNPAAPGAQLGDALVVGAQLSGEPVGGGDGPFARTQ